MKVKKFESIKLRFKGLLWYATWILIIILLASTVKNIGKVNAIRKQIEDERIKVERMQTENVELQSRIVESQGSDFIEKQIRDKLGLSREGEAIVILPEESVVKSLSPPQTTQEDILPDPNWRKWFKLFF